VYPPAITTDIKNHPHSIPTITRNTSSQHHHSITDHNHSITTRHRSIIAASLTITTDITDHHHTSSQHHPSITDHNHIIKHVTAASPTITVAV